MVRTRLPVSAAAFTLSCLSLLIGPAAAGDAPALPKDIAPLAPELNKKVEAMERAAEKYRGLPFKQPVPCGSIEKDGLKKKMVEALQEELPADKMAALEAGLKAFGLIPQDMVLEQYFPELLTSQVGGFYDPKRKYLAIVKSADGLLGKEAKAQYGPDLADRMEETVLVHELTHAIQDQHFDIEKFAKENPLSDDAAARVALIEGDATLTMYDYFAGMRLESMPGVEPMLSQMFKDPKQLLAMSPDMPGSKEMAEAPAWFRDNLLFSYMQGFTFAISVRKAGGQKLLDYAYTKDPPRSTEQILHPEKWHTKRDDPVAITWPDLSKELPGYKKLCEGELGEQTIRVLLREHLKDELKVTTAAAGWGGDRFAVYEKDKNVVLAWITEWDTMLDCKEFREALAAFGAGWNFDAPGPTRVVLVRGSLSDAEAAAVKAKLAEAPSQLPENKNIDLAALGAKRTKEGDAADMAKALEGLLDSKDGNVDIGKLLNDPELQKAAEKLAGDLGGGEKPGDKAGGDKGGGDKGGGLDVGAILNDPEAQALIKNMFSQERPQGQASADGNSYTNEQIGFAIKLPASQKGWKLDPKPAPPTSVLITSPQSAVQVSVVSQALPIPIGIENMGPMLEMGPKMAVQNYKKLSAGFIETSGRKGYELQYEGDNGGQHLRSTQRVYTAGATMIVLTVMATADDWTTNEKAITETLNGFSLMDPKPAPAKDASKKDAPKEALKEE